jgi:hypothetical protein
LRAEIFPQNPLDLRRILVKPKTKIKRGAEKSVPRLLLSLFYKVENLRFSAWGIKIFVFYPRILARSTGVQLSLVSRGFFLKIRVFW